MNLERHYKVILGPHVTEKTARAGEEANSYAFKVAPDATKPEIRAAVEHLFGVKVRGVSTVNVKGKVKRTMRGLSRKKNWKKAYVRLEEGHEIEFAPVD
jgi:large subunit ribosomal protein L23